jgi:hypothetical protein
VVREINSQKGSSKSVNAAQKDDNGIMVRDLHQKSKRLKMVRIVGVVLGLVFITIGFIGYWYLGWGEEDERSDTGDDGGSEEMKCVQYENVIESFGGDKKWLLIEKELEQEFSVRSEIKLKLNVDDKLLDAFESDDLNIYYEIKNKQGVVRKNYFKKMSESDPQVSESGGGLSGSDSKSNNSVELTNSTTKDSTTHDSIKKESNISYEGTINMNNLGDLISSPGKYWVNAVIESPCGVEKSKDYEILLSYPVYITWTIDWEGSDIPQQNLNDMDVITSKHRDFPLTHFFNPRIYILESMSNQRRQYLTNWVLYRRDNFGHSIGLHLHMFPDMVSAAGVEPQYKPAWGWHRDDGYDILVSGYPYAKMDKILKWSKQQFAANGLNEPKTFRAGGWFADSGTLKVLEDNGFILDSSGRTKFSIGTNQVETPWDLKTTTQPYRPNINNQNSDKPPNMDIWEFPNNGGNAYTLTSSELYKAFTDNYSGGVASKRKVVTYLSHPDWFQEDKPKMDEVLTKIERYMYEDDNGPVIFTTLDDVYKVIKD